MISAELYKDIDQILAESGALVSRRHYYIAGMTPEDLAQEVRIAVMDAAASYDFNKGNGQLLPWLRTIATNVFREAYAKSRRQSRAPKEGLLEYDTVIDLTAGSPEEPCRELMQVESAEEAVKILVGLKDKLDEIDLKILECHLDPPKELLEVMAEFGDDDVPSNVALAKHLGVTKNVVDWAWHKVRMAFSELALDDTFSELFGDALKGKGWPQAHVSKGTHFHERFIKRTMEKRGLSREPVRLRQVEINEIGSRCIEEYQWGVVLRVVVDNVYWTAVVEGRFAPRAGEVFGENGARLTVPIDGYKKLARAFSEVPVAEPKRPLPVCLGEYEAGHEVCDGAKKSPACEHRNTCVAICVRMQTKNTSIKAYVEEHKDSAGTPYLVARDQAKFDKIVAATIATYEIEQGALGRAAPAPSPRGRAKTFAEAKASRLAKEAKRAKDKDKGGAPVKALRAAARDAVLASARRLGEPAAKRRTQTSVEMDDWMKDWLRVILEGTGRTFAKDDALAQPGQIYMKDRRVTSGYFGLYCKQAGGRDVPIAVFMYKPRKKQVDLKLPLTPEKIEISANAAKVLKISKHSDGSFKAIASGLDQMGVMIGAEAIVKLVSKGLIGLPDASNS